VAAQLAASQEGLSSMSEMSQYHDYVMSVIGLNVENENW
jgi:hypothetical protein